MWIFPARTGPARLRTTVRALARSAGGSNLLADNAALVAGELAAMSIRQRGGPLLVALEASQAHVTIDIRDRVVGSPPTARVRQDRAWSLVRRLAADWGCDVDEDGRRMWAVLRAAHTRPAAHAMS